MSTLHSCKISNQRYDGTSRDLAHIPTTSSLLQHLHLCPLPLPMPLPHYIPHHSSLAAVPHRSEPLIPQPTLISQKAAPYPTHILSHHHHHHQDALKKSKGEDAFAVAIACIWISCPWIFPVFFFFAFLASSLAFVYGNILTAFI